MNRAMTIVYAWWDLPFVSNKYFQLKEDEINAIYKQIKNNLKKSEPYVGGVLTRRVGLKKCPEIRFIRDTFESEVLDFMEQINQNKDEIIKEKVMNKLNEDNDNSSEYNFFKIFDNPNILQSIHNTIENFKDPKIKSLLNEVFAFEPQLKVSKKLKAICEKDTKFYEIIKGLLKNIHTPEKKKKQTRRDIRMEKKKNEALEKLRIHPEALQNKEFDSPDYNNKLNNFLFHYDRKIPKEFSTSLSREEIEAKANKLEFISEQGENEFKKYLRRAARKANPEKAIIKTKREKAALFWDNLK